MSATSRRAVLAGSVGVTTAFAVPASAGRRSRDASLIEDCRRAADLQRRIQPMIDAGAADLAAEISLRPQVEQLQSEQNTLLDRVFHARATTIEGVHARVHLVSALRPFDWREVQDFDARDRLLAGLVRDLETATRRGLL